MALASLLTLALCTASLSEPPVSAHLLDEPHSSLALQLTAGAVAAAITVPGSMLVGTWVGMLSSNLVLAALPALAIVAVVPPLAVTWAVWLTGNWNAPRTFRFQPAFWVTLGINVLALVAAGFLGVSTQQVSTLALFTLAEVIVLPSASTATMRLTRPSPLPSPPAEPRLGLPPAITLPVASFAF